MSRGFYITGTDTGAGKTSVCVALLRYLQAHGARAVGMKPVASGCSPTAQGLRNDDALALQAVSVPMPDYRQVNPVALAAATAPQIAAALDGATISLPVLVSAFEALSDLGDTVVVEGVGGWLAPFADGLEQADLVRALDLPVILVVGMKLGCLNHARLSEAAVLASGLRLQGWIASYVHDDLEHAPAYQQLLERQLSVRCLGVLGHGDSELSRCTIATLGCPGAVESQTSGRGSPSRA